jgi:hypothetical protein
MASAQLGDLLDKVKLPPIPGLSGGLKELLEGSPLTTSIKDTWDGFEFLDGFVPSGARHLARVPQGSDGKYLLEPGYYVGTLKSYCLKPGTHGPYGGNGYLNAPLKGRKAAIISKLLRVSTDVSGGPSQREMQQLLWSIIARTEFDRLTTAQKAIALTHLSPADLLELNGGALGLLPDNTMNSITGGVDRALAPLLQAENQIRGLAAQANSTYDDFQRIAVLGGAPPSHKDDKNIPGGRWLLDRSGFFVRYKPQGYPQTRMEVYAPEAFEFKQDGQGRLSEIVDKSGLALIVRYGGDLVKGDNALAQTLEAMELRRGSDVLARIEGGWTLVGRIVGKSGLRSGSFGGAKQRLDEARLRQSAFSDFRRKAEDKKEQIEFEGITANVMHLFDSVDEKGNGAYPFADFLGRASMASVSRLARGAGNLGAAPTAFDPSDLAAMPAATNGQRIGLGGGPKDKPKCDEPAVEGGTVLRDIPGIMRANQWGDGAVLLDEWFARKARKAQLPLDFSLPDPLKVPWDLVAGSYGRKALEDLTSESMWSGSQKVGAALMSVYGTKIRTASPGKPVAFGGSPGFGGDKLRELHALHVQHVPVDAYIYMRFDPDALTASMGRYGLYAIPEGRALVEADGTLVAEVNAIHVYALDSFSFNEDDSLGYWNKTTNSVDLLIPRGDKFVSASDSAFREYRECSGQGGDFLVYSAPVRVTLPSPQRIVVSRGASELLLSSVRRATQ